MKKEIFSQPITFEQTVNEDGSKKLAGYAVKYGVETSQPRRGPGGKKYHHKFRAGSFDDVLVTSPKVALIFGHDHNMVMANTENGTLSIQSDDVGIRFEADLADVSYATDAHTLIERGDISQMSFGVKPGEYEIFEDGEKNVLEHTSVANLYELSVVLFPAFNETEVVAMEEEVEEEKPKTYNSKTFELKTETLKLKKSA